MKVAVAESVSNKLEEQSDVLAAEVERGRNPEVRAYVPNQHARSRVKRSLHEYPVYVNLEIVDPEEFDVQ